MKTYKFKINGKDYEVAINSVEGKQASVTVNGADYQVELENAPAAAPAAPAAAPAPAVQATAPAAPAAKPAAGPGQKVAVIEAMKMENEIAAENDGTVTAIHVAKGDSVLEGADIVTIA